MNRSPVSRRRRQVLQSAGAATALGALGFPAIVRSQADAIRFGHLTPRTGFLGPLGEYAVMGVTLAVEEINGGGGIMGRKVELIAEDSVNPQTASTKAERLIERDKVAAIIGEISSASGLAIAQVAQRNRIIFFNTGCNSDELRGKACNRYMFHTEAANTMYVYAAGQAHLRDGMVKGKKWYSLTADYAFGHDLLKAAKRFMLANGAEFVGDDLVPTDAADFSAYLLKIRNAKPDVVVSNLAGAQITNFMKQYVEYGLPYPVAGFAFASEVPTGRSFANRIHPDDLVQRQLALAAHFDGEGSFDCEYRLRDATGYVNAGYLVVPSALKVRGRVVARDTKGHLALVASPDGHARVPPGKRGVTSCGSA